MESGKFELSSHYFTSPFLPNSLNYIFIFSFLLCDRDSSSTVNVVASHMVSLDVKMEHGIQEMIWANSKLAN